MLQSRWSWICVSLIIVIRAVKRRLVRLAVEDIRGDLDGVGYVMWKR